MNDSVVLSGDKLSEAFSKYTGSYAVEQGISDKSKKNRRNFIIKLQKFLEGKSFHLQTAKEFIDSLRTTQTGTSAATTSIIQYIKDISAFCQFLVNEEYINVNFCKKITRPKTPDRDIKLISEEKAFDVIIAGTTPGKGDRAPSIYKKQETRQGLLFVLFSGRRISEMLRLKGVDLNLDDDPPYYEVRQKGRQKTQPFECPPNMLDELRKRQHNNKVFDTSEDACNTALRRGLKALSIDKEITVHRLRDIFSVTRLRSDIPLQKVSRLLGHKNSQITDEYYSDFIMTDLSEGLRTSQIMRSGLTIPELFNNTEKAVHRAAKDKRLSINISKGEKEMVIRITTVEN